MSTLTNQPSVDHYHKLMCTYLSRKEQENPALAGPKSQFQPIRREIGYYLLILREKYGIMGVYSGMTIGIMATFLHDVCIVSLWLSVAGWINCKVGLRKVTLRYYQEHPGGCISESNPKTLNPQVEQQAAQISQKSSET
jgi:hypothetical protein